MSLDITRVELAGGCRLILTFEGGEQRETDLGQWVTFTGVFAPLEDPAYFRQVKVVPAVGTIVWPNGADLCPDVLYEKSGPLARTAEPPTEQNR